MTVILDYVLLFVELFLVIMGMVLFYAWKNPIMKNGKNGSYDPLGHTKFDVALVYLISFSIILLGDIIIALQSIKWF
ncbi:MAG: hypothetical protein KAS78_00535 [Candidatus Pacebacteria bacterium]|nr:hypothetical protein [Candidatus Paceibacterota bacterium]